MKVLVIGEVLWDIFEDKGTRELGGASGNFANRLCEGGHQVSLLAGVGDDVAGKKALGLLADTTQLDLSLVQVFDAPTGTVPITVSKEGVPSYTITPDVAFDQIRFSPELKERMHEFEMIYFTTLIQRTEFARKTVKSVLEAAPKALKVYDVNLRRDCYTEKIVEDSLRSVDIVKISDSELEEIVEMFKISGNSLREKMKNLSNHFGLQTLYVTLGPKGAVAIDSTSENLVYDPGYEVEVLDPVGCGDSFFAGALLKKLAGADLLEQIQNGNLLGAINANRAGALTPITNVDIEKFKSSPVQRSIAQVSE